MEITDVGNEDYQKHTTPNVSPPAVIDNTRSEQQSIEPLSRNELLYGGVSIIVLMILCTVFEMTTTSAFEADSEGIVDVNERYVFEF